MMLTAALFFQNMRGTAHTAICEFAHSGYNLARMKFEILFTPEAIADIKALRAHERAAVKDAVAQNLRFRPTAASTSGIKRLRGLSKPQYRLRVGNLRVFYDVTENEVVILAVVPKSGVDGWLTRFGEQDDEKNRAV